jgi:hypothetical protein
MAFSRPPVLPVARIRVHVMKANVTPWTTCPFVAPLRRSPKTHHDTRLCRSRPRAFSILAQYQQNCSKSNPASKCQNDGSKRILSTAFWASPSTWRRASVNTFRCLIGCTLGDFSAMWLLQSYYQDLGVAPIMAISSGNLPSISLYSLPFRH